MLKTACSSLTCCRFTQLSHEPAVKGQHTVNICTVMSMQLTCTVWFGQGRSRRAQNQKDQPPPS